MSLKSFLARKNQYLKLDILSFNSYIYYLARRFTASTRAFNLLSHTFNLQNPVFSLLTRGFKLVSRRFELVTCISEL